MGSELARLVAVHGAHLPGAAFKVLNRIAWMALDDGPESDRPPRVYFGGWEPLALALGHEVPMKAPSNEGRRKKLEQYVGRAINQLRDNDMIEPADEDLKPGFGRRQVWFVLVGLPPAKRGARGPSRRDDAVTHSPTPDPHESGGFAPHDLGGNSPPKTGSVAPPNVGGLLTSTSNTNEQDHFQLGHLGSAGSVSARAGITDAHRHDFEPWNEISTACAICGKDTTHNIHQVAS